jgi:hypothetical protein
MLTIAHSFLLPTGVDPSVDAGTGAPPWRNGVRYKSYVHSLSRFIRSLSAVGLSPVWAGGR